MFDLDKPEERVGRAVVDAAVQVHRELGPGLLESVYEAILFESLVKRGLSVQRQLPIPIVYDDLFINEGFRADIVIEGRLLLELKSVEAVAADFAGAELGFSG